MFGVGGGYRPGRATYKIDGLTVPQVMFMEVINSGAIGGAFGLLEMSARMSVPKFSHYSVGDKNYGDNFGEAWGQAAETHGTLTRNWIVNDNWALNLSLIPHEQQQPTTQQEKVNIISLRSEMTTVKKIEEVVNFAINSEECTKAFEAVGATPISKQLNNLTIVTENVFKIPGFDSQWTWNSDIGDKMREAFKANPTTNDLTWIGEYGDTGRRFMGITNRAIEEKLDWLPVAVIHSFIHSGEIKGGQTWGEWLLWQRTNRTWGEWFWGRHPHDLRFLGKKYDDIIKSCTKRGESKIGKAEQ